MFEPALVYYCRCGANRSPLIPLILEQQKLLERSVMEQLRKPLRGPFKRWLWWLRWCPPFRWLRWLRRIHRQHCESRRRQMRRLR